VREPQLLEELFRECYARLVHFSFQLTGNKAGAEDIVQDAFARYLDLRDHISDNKLAVKAWLYNTVRNKSLNLLRHEQVEKKYLNLQSPDPSDNTQAMHAMIRSEVVAEIIRAVDSLPEGCRRIVLMSYMDGKKNQEIAEELGISVNTVKTQKKRALQLLRLQLKPEVFSFVLLFFS
jgi:RNA polymerase sigma-70 factor (family 1)